MMMMMMMYSQYKFSTFNAMRAHCTSFTMYQVHSIVNRITIVSGIKYVPGTFYCKSKNRTMTSGTKLRTWVSSFFSIYNNIISFYGCIILFTLLLVGQIKGR
uniref:Uncharacterized protein n=1 Tax=Cacopsylla melanoneura TaxID=428564 RepID=A0A8D8YN87_9HEMI